MFMEKYETDLFDKIVGSSIEDIHRTVDARFCSTSAYVHTKEGIYHGDIKPEGVVP